MSTFLPTFMQGYLVFLTGRCTEPKFTDNEDQNKCVLSWQMVSNSTTKDGTKISEWIRCFSYGKDATYLNGKFAKGDSISCVGTLRTYKPRDGEKQDDTRKFAVVGTLQSVTKRLAPDESPSEEPTKTSEEDLPF